MVDRGVTLAYLKSVLEQRRPRRCGLWPCSISRDAACRRLSPTMWASRFPTSSGVGFGLDDAEKYRNLDDIWVVD